VSSKLQGLIWKKSIFSLVRSHQVIHQVIHLHTKFGDSRFSRSGDMIAGIKIKNGLWDLDHAPITGGLSSIG